MMAGKLVKWPEQFRQHHFSLPREILVFGVEEVDGGTTRMKTLVHK